jgi:hypothetical protein
MRSGKHPSLICLATAVRGSPRNLRWPFFSKMTTSEFRDEMLRLTAEKDSEGVICLYESHAGALAGQLSPEQIEEVYGVALPLAHFRLCAVKQFPDLARQLGLLS